MIEVGPLKAAESEEWDAFLRQVNDASLLEATPDELVGRFPGFHVLPFSALHRSVV